MGSVVMTVDVEQEKYSDKHGKDSKLESTIALDVARLTKYISKEDLEPFLSDIEGMLIKYFANTYESIWDDIWETFKNNEGGL